MGINCSRKRGCMRLCRARLLGPASRLLTSMRKRMGSLKLGLVRKFWMGWVCNVSCQHSTKSWGECTRFSFRRPQARICQNSGVLGKFHAGLGSSSRPGDCPSVHDSSPYDCGYFPACCGAELSSSQMQVPKMAVSRPWKPSSLMSQAPFNYLDGC